MRPDFYYSKLDCPMTRELVQTTQGVDAATASDAGALLVMLGFFSQDAPVDLPGLKSVVKGLKKDREFKLLEAIQRHCADCPLLAECDVGRIVSRGRDQEE